MHNKPYYTSYPNEAIHKKANSFSIKKPNSYSCTEKE